MKQIVKKKILSKRLLLENKVSPPPLLLKEWKLVNLGAAQTSNGAIVFGCNLLLVSRTSPLF